MSSCIFTYFNKFAGLQLSQQQKSHLTMAQNCRPYRHGICPGTWRSSTWNLSCGEMETLEIPCLSESIGCYLWTLSWHFGWRLIQDPFFLVCWCHTFFLSNAFEHCSCFERNTVFASYRTERSINGKLIDRRRGCSIAQLSRRLETIGPLGIQLLLGSRRKTLGKQ